MTTGTVSPQKMKFSINDFFSECDQSAGNCKVCPKYTPSCLILDKKTIQKGFATKNIKVSLSHLKSQKYKIFFQDKLWFSWLLFYHAHKIFRESLGGQLSPGVNYFFLRSAGWKSKGFNTSAKPLSPKRKSNCHNRLKHD